MMREFPAEAEVSSPDKLKIYDLLLRKKGRNTSKSNSIPRRSEMSPCLPSFAQQRLWLLDQLEEGGSSFYNVPLAVRLEGEFNPGAFTRSLSEIVRRHEVLRTTFSSVEGQPMQVIAPAVPVDLPFIDLSGLSEVEREAETQRLSREEARQRFDLAHGPLLRARLVKRAEQEHVALFTLHHIISDAWSKDLLIKEVAALYTSYQAGEESALAELSIQYADYAVWQRKWLQGEVLERELSYWREQLAGAPAVLELPADRPRPASPSHRGARQSLVLTAELSAALKQLSQREGVTMFMLLLAAFQVLLSRYSGQEDVCVGTSIAGRGRLETEELIGFFVNTLVLRTRVTGEARFTEVLGRVREVCLGAYAHQDVPFERLVEELQPERSLSHTPLFQVFFSLQNAPRKAAESSGLRFLGVERKTAQFDLMLSVAESEGQLYGSFEYSTDLFDEPTIQRMVGHFQTLLNSIVGNPEERISELEMLGEAERQQLLVEWNDTAREYADEWCVKELFEQQAERTPEALALSFAAEQLSYAELNGRANQLAHYLRSIGVGPEVRVAICLQRSVALMVGVLAVLKAGGAYVPLDAHYPLERLAYLLSDCEAAVLLTQESLLAGLPSHWAQEVCLDRDWELITAGSKENLRASALGEHLAYVIYTSGSSGSPKGVMISQAGLAHYLRWALERYQVAAGAGAPVHSALGFDLTVTSLWLPLLAGRTTELLSEEGGVEGLVGALRGQRDYSLVKLTPSHLEGLNQLLAGAEAAGATRRLVVGGEALLGESLSFWREHAPGISIINEYGPTETVVGCCVYEVSGAEGESGAIPIGRPIDNTQLYILDEYQALVAVGVKGELYIGGKGVARGYLKRPGLTAEKFIPDPFSTRAGARLYRTGDLARYLSDGNIEYLGRTDNQVKVRGFRIELGEIESVLSQHSQVREAVVVVQETAAGQKQLVGYVVTEAGAELSTSELRQHLTEKLPKYMIPALFVQLEELPLTPNGKVDRRALPEPDSNRPNLPDRFVPPRTPVEELTLSIWQHVLGLERVGIHDNFFELGGHSLLATQVISRIKKAFNVELSLRQVFESPTVAALAERINTASQHSDINLVPALQAVSREERLPLSFAQQRLWFLQQLEPESTAYNLPLAVRLSGALDRSALQRSLSEIVRRHEALRTTFATAAGEPVQVIHPAVAVSLPLIDLSRLGETVREGEAERLSREEAGQVFSLERGPLLRARLIKESEQEHVALLTMHHIVSDGWSMGVLIKEVAALYGAYQAGAESALAELRIQYADYAAWQRKWLQGEVLERELSYWREQLAGAPAVLELPADQPRPASPSQRGARQSLVLTAALSAALKQLGQREGVTMFMLLLAAFQVLLSRYSGQEEIVVGSPIANRNRSETEELIGFFVNTLVLRTRVTGEARFTEVLGRVREVCLGAYAHQDVPFEKLVEELEPERSLRHTPLFQVMLVLQNAPQGSLELPGLELRGFGREGQTAKFDLLLALGEREGQLGCTFEYSTDLFEAATIARLGAHFQRLLESIVSNPQQCISELEMLSAAEREQLLVEWNDTATAYPQQLNVSQLFEQQVERTPDANALTAAAEQLTYAELNSRANQLAHYLQERGVGVEDRVGVLLERSVEMVVCLLAILKAGAAYVPLDPSYPEARLSFMIEDARLRVLLTETEFTEAASSPLVAQVCVDAEKEAIASRPGANLRGEVGVEHLAYIIYTSGSSGQPKGVEIPHRAINRLVCQSNYISFLESDCVAYASNTSFDAATWEVWGALLNGARLVLVTQEVVLSPPALAAQIEAQGITVMFLTTPLFNQMALSEPQAFGGMRCVMFGGEAADAQAVREVLQHGAPEHLLNGYGPTENTTFSTWYRVREIEETARTIPIGRPIANSQAYVLDRELKPVAVGVRGELYVGGDGLARNYQHRPELTAERFIPHRYSGKPGARLYRTGDLARYLADGNIEYLGRTDNQVKVRGYRIELGEIEVVLRQHPQVREAVVVAQETTGGGGQQRLVGYVVPEAEAELRPSELRQYLAEKLPEQMIPASFVFLAELPLTPNGKVDRRALPEPDGSRPEQEGAYVAARTPVEELVVSIWQQVLGLEQVGIYDNFFELGGHSLLATQVVSRIRQTFSVELPLRALFEAPTVAGLAECVNTASQHSDINLVPALQAVSREERLPLSFAQQRLWFLQQLEPESTAYNLPLAVRLSGALDRSALQRSLSEIVRRHEALRTTFATAAGEPVQVIHPAVAVSLPLIDLSRLGETVREGEAERLSREEAAQVFSLERGPLLRARLIKESEQEHVALFTMHHIVSDGWSMGVLIKEVAALYGAYQAGAESALAELRIQYADYAAWQRKWLQGEVLERELSYWREQLAGAPAVLELPADQPRPASPSHRGARQSLVLTAELTAALKQLGQREGVTMFMLLLAAFQVLLSRYSGQEEIVVGSPIANRNRSETEELIGFFVNTLVLRTRVTGEARFTEVLGRVREVCLGAYAHQDVPFEKLVEELEPERSLRHTPLFQVMLVLQNAPQRSLELPGLELRGFGREGQTAKFDLLLALGEREGQLGCTFEYSTDLFEAATIARLGAHFQRLLESIVSNPQQCISELEMLSAAEREQLLVEFNDTLTAYPQERCLPELFEQQARLTPEAVAVVFEDERLSFAELSGKANQLARYLQRMGVGPEVRVGICVERSMEMLVAVLGILKAGGAYVPLDPVYPQERLAFMLEEASLAVLLTQGGLRDRLESGACTVVSLDDDWERIAEESAAKVASAATAANLAYVLFTSGSTGRPKGVAMSHRALANLIAWQLGSAAPGEGAKTLQFASLNFDVSFQEIFATWCSGGTLVLVSEEVRQDPVALLGLLREQEVNRVFLPFVALQQLADAAAEDERLLPQSLREVVTAGEQLQTTPSLVRFFASLAGCVLHNQYGPTEGHVVSAYTLDAEVKGWESLPPIGMPIANTQLYLLGAHLEPVPVGVAGELHIGGVGLARGYLNRPALTAGRFIPDPFSARAGARLYRTGDLARYLADGNIEYLGRTDNQVKVRGYRIELGEIEVVLRQHLQVREAVVVAQETTGGGGQQRLVGYVVPEAEAELRPSELRQYLAEKLPEQMIPASFVFLAELPLTPNGKVDRRALPEPDGSRPEQEGAYVAARTPVEELVVSIWQQVLGLEQVGIYDNFFELGGHSLLATQVVSRIRQTFSVELPLRALFEAPTVAGLAECVNTASQHSDINLVPALQAVSREERLPLSFAQQRLWFLQQLEPESTAYNLPLAVRLSGALDRSALQRSLSEIVRRHEALRTTFATAAGEPVQVIHPAVAVSLPLIDLSRLGETVREGEAERLSREEAGQVFSLERGPLLRARLIKESEQEHVALLTMHHIVSDGWSMGVLIKEVAALYGAYQAGAESALAELRIQYADYAAWQRKWLQGEVLERELSYWREQLAGAPAVLELPADRPRPATPSQRGARQSLVLTAALSAALKQLGQREGVTMFMLLLAAFQVLLSRYSGQEEIVVGSPIANRNRSETEELIGFFVNTLVLRTRVTGEARFTEVLGRVREVCLGAYAHQDVPFEKLVEELEPERSLRHTPLFQVMLVLQNAPQGSLELPGLELRGFGREGQTAKFDLLLALGEREGQLGCTFEYSTDLFEAATIARLGAHFQRLLESIVSNPQQCISELEMLSAAEREQLLVEWNDTATAYPQQLSVSQLFEQQVERTPDANALTAAAEQLTYAELNSRANQLAHYLQERGVGVEDRVGVLLERSVEMVVCLLAILKAGAAYVPLDPSYPEARLSFMIEDARLRVLLTETEFAEAASSPLVAQVCVDAEKEAIASRPGANLRGEVGVEHLAYIIYTSGSSGQPKGVEIPHRAINRLVCQSNYISFLESDCVAYASNTSFDAATWEVWGALLNGARLVLVTQEVVLSPPALAAQIEAQGITVMFLTTPLFNQMALSEPQAFGGMRCVMFGGEAADAQAVREVLQHGAPEHLLNGYGPTENTTFSTWYRVREIEETARTIPIGRPIANSQAYVLDRELKPVAVGVRGELYVGGDGLARNYQHRPELTAERFIPHRYSGKPGARLYRTGDLARYLADGNIEYLGRTDNQVKVRGYRIELGEIEVVLRQHPQVREAVVVAQETTGGGGQQRLVGYVVPEAEAELRPSELRQYLAEKLPEQMIPASFVFLAELPLTPNGKVDRRALPEPDGSRPEQEGAYVAARTPVEELVVSIWQQVLGLEQVGIYDNFFELGGHSLLATQVVSRIRQTFSVELPLRALFEAPTVAGLAVLVENNDHQQKYGSAPVITRADTESQTEMLKQLEQFSDEELDSLLSGVLSDTEQV